MQSSGDKSTSWIERIPRATRVKLLILSAGVIVLVIIVAWLMFLPLSIPESNSNDEQGQRLHEIQEQWQLFVERSRESITDVTETVQQLEQQATQTATLTEAQIEAFKNQLHELNTSSSTATPELN